MQVAALWNVYVEEFELEFQFLVKSILNVLRVHINTLCS